MSGAPQVAEGPAGQGGAGLRFPALCWALLHVPVFIALYAQSIAAALRATPEGFRAPLWPTFLPQALLLAAIGFAAALPLSLWPRVYRFGAGLLLGLGTAVLVLDSRLYAGLSFHLNGFFLRVLLQPNAIRESGVMMSEVAWYLAGAVVFIGLDALAGAWFLRRFASARRAWPLALALLFLSAAERVYGGALTAFGGPAIFAASTVMPLQVPVRMEGFVRKALGRKGPANPFAGARESMRLPAGVAPEAVRFARTPDVLLVAAESLPADHLDPRTMPNLWRRVHEGGAIFTRHYAGACSTNYTLFALIYGLQAQKLEAVVGSGRRPVLFSALRRNGYALRFLAASCVDWMELKDTVFSGVQDDLKTWCDGLAWDDRDAAMLADARAFVQATPPKQPLFLFLFFFGTHFNYFYPPSSAIYEPAWDGAGGIKATAEPGWKIQNRARNAAHALDASLEELLRFVEARRGRAPLVIFTGDHGEEFRQKGHIGHGSDVTDEQVHVPLAVFGEGVPRGDFDAPTSHVDVVPTLFDLLGDRHPPALYSDGLPAYRAPQDRFVLTTVGWEPQYAVIGKDLKVKMYAGGGSTITDPEDRPLPDGPARMARDAGKILAALRGEEAPRAAPAAR